MEEDVRAAAAGDRRAFTRLVERHRGAVCAVALGITGDVVMSEDVAQEVFVKAWRSLSSLSDTDAFRAWLLESARNRARDVVRTRAARPTAPESALDDVADPAPSPTDRMVEREDARVIEASLATLPEDDREVLALYYREGQRLSEVAEQLGISEDAARQRLSRSRRRLQADVERRLGESLARTTPGAGFLGRVQIALPAAPAAGIPAWIVGAAALAGAAAIALLIVPKVAGQKPGSPAESVKAAVDRGAAPAGGTRAPAHDAGGKPGSLAESGHSSRDVSLARSAASERDLAASALPVEQAVELPIRVTFTGTPPVPRRIKKTPECGTSTLVDDEVRVQDGGLANVLVRVVEGAPPVEGTGQGVEIVQEACVYLPRISGIVAGQSIAVTSRDAFLHNVHTFRGDVSIFNKGQPAPGTFVKEASDFVANGEVVKNGPVTFKCDVHPWMVSHVVVNPNPYFAVTGADGRASIRLPPGRYTLEAWHEKFGTKTVAIDTNGPGVLFEYSGREGRLE